jgi:type II secretory pathway predicted ATPase ExeA
VGSGKSTALRHAAGKLHPSQYKVVSVVATTGPMADILKQICSGFDVDGQTNSLARLTQTIKTAILEIANRKQTPVLIIDEASLLRWEVFAQLHTLSQFDMDSRPLLPMILAGQNNLMDNLMFHTSRPLASRILGKSHLEGLKYKDMAGYLKHHLKIAGVKEMETTVYNPQKGRLETLDVEINNNNTTWFNNGRTPRDIRMITDYRGGIIMAEFDYTYPIWIYDVTRTDIGFNAQKAKKLKRQFE